MHNDEYQDNKNPIVVWITNQIPSAIKQDNRQH